MTTAMATRPGALSVSSLPTRSSSYLAHERGSDDGASTSRTSSRTSTSSNGRRPTSSVGLGLNFACEGEESIQSSVLKAGDLAHQHEATTAAATLLSQQDQTPRVAQKAPLRRHSRQVSAGSELDNEPRLDTALQYVGRGPFNGLNSAKTSRSALNARRRGRAMYLNDQLQFNSKAQAKAFHSTLIEWQSSRGGGSELEGLEEDEMTVLLAQARSMAQASSKGALDSPWKPLHSRTPSQSDVPARMRQSNEPRMGGLRTSASTPEGALGKVALPYSVEDAVTPWNRLGNDDDESLSVPSNGGKDGFADDTTDRATGMEMDTLRAGLRFVIGCYDDLVKQKERQNGLSEALIASMSRSQESAGTGTPSVSFALQQPRNRSRSRSILKTLARKSAALTSDLSRGNAFTSGPSTSSVLELDITSTEPTSDQVSGPSNRYGMAHVSPVAFPADDAAAEANGFSAFTPTLSKSKTGRSRTGSTSLSSPLSSRRSGLTDSPSARPETITSPLDMDQVALSSALHRAYHSMNQLEEERRKADQEMEEMSESLFAEANEMVRRERIKSAALEKELDTLKAAFSGSDAEQQGQAGVNDTERGANSEEEDTMMAAVALAARETAEAEAREAEAEEREAEWQSHCEQLERRVDVLEEALFHAMELLAEKEGSGVFSAGTTDAEADAEAAADADVDTEAEAGPSANNTSAVDREEAVSAELSSPSNRSPLPERATLEDGFSDSASDFYSAGEENGRDEATPSVSLSRNSGAFLATFLSHFPGDQKGESKTSRGMEEQQEQEQAEEHGHPEERGSSPSEKGDTKSVKVPGSVALPANDEASRASSSDDKDVSAGQENGVGCEKASVREAWENHRRRSRIVSMDMASATSSSSPRSSTSGVGRSRRDSTVSSIRHSWLPPKLPHPTSPLPSLPGFSQEAGPEEEHRAASMPSPAFVVQNSSSTSPPTRDISSPVQQDDAPWSGSGGDDRPIVKQSRSSSVRNSLIDYSARRGAAATTQSRPHVHRGGMPSLSIAGGLASASPSEMDTFGSRWADSQDEVDPPAQLFSHDTPTIKPAKVDTSQSSALPGASKLMSRSKSLREVPIAETTSSAPSSQPPPMETYAVSVAESAETGKSKVGSSQSSGTKRSQGGRKSASKHSILAHLPTLPSTASAPTGLSRQTSFSASLHSDQSSVSSNPTLEHYQRLHHSHADEPSGKKAHFSRRTRFSEARSP